MNSPLTSFVDNHGNTILAVFLIQDLVELSCSLNSTVVE